MRRWAPLVLVALLVVLAGCGGTTGVGTDGTPASTTAPTDGEPTAGTTDDGTTTATGQASANGSVSVHFINVEQGSSTLIVGPTNETILIDSGDWRDDGEDVLEYLRANDIDRIDHLVTTHADADHIGGHAAVIEYFETEADGVGAVYDPGITSSSQTYERYLDAVEAHNVTLYETRAGDGISFDGASVDVLAPPESYVASGDRNENSIVLRVAHGGSSFLLPGDAGPEGEEYLVDEYDSALNVSVLQAGHHGSDTSSSAALLDAATPRVAVISSAYDSQYGHPDEAVLERFAARSIQTYWTATHGDIVLTSNGTAIAVATQETAPTSAVELRDGDAVAPGTGGAVQQRTVFEVGGEADPIVTDGGSDTPTSTPTSTPGESSALAIATIHEEPAGDEYDNLNDEYVVFENSGGEELDLSGWTVWDAADHTYTFPSGFTLDAGAQVTVHTGSGQDTETDLYWGSGSPIWNNGGDTVIVRDDAGELVIEEAYP
ncbi:competence protein [Halorientalis sp. IM1011]|uniref:lamin tail domain-containing protein n=1 Tax=Halorientalis sp. IM1011 TaxID=1932360 RepID=UPI00097CD1BC|nr:lamin tail domain-containing protein [Halorientalis sp. IM1011]AQL42085.1 competence protein [Halorientalis sp. IM1011]